MKYVSAVIFALMASQAQAQEKPEWLDDLSTACEKARKEHKIILCRQALCDCTEKKCPLLDLARHPWYFENESRRRFAGERMVLLTSHVSATEAFLLLGDPGLTERISPPKASTLRTLFLSPSRQILNRLDVCPYASDVDAEMDFALWIEEECFDETGVPKKGGLLRVHELQCAHRTRPQGYHKRVPIHAYEKSWQTDFREAASFADKSKKLVLYFQVVGIWDNEGC